MAKRVFMNRGFTCFIVRPYVYVFTSYLSYYSTLPTTFKPSSWSVHPTDAVGRYGSRAWARTRVAHSVVSGGWAVIAVSTISSAFTDGERSGRMNNGPVLPWLSITNNADVGSTASAGPVIHF